MNDDIQGLPDVDSNQLAAMIDQNSTPDKVQGVAQQNQEPIVDQQPSGEPEIDLAQFKNPKDLLKGYKEVQGAFTRTSQENKALKDQLSQINERLEMSALQQPLPVQQQARSFDEMFVENPEKAIDIAVEQKLHFARIADVLESEANKNPQDPAEFQERYAAAMHVRQFYPQLTQSAAGVKKLFELGDRLRIENAKKNAERMIKMTFGEDVDVAKFRNMIKKDNTPTDSSKINKNLAYMPDTSGSGIRTGADTGKTNIDTQIQDAAGRGDVDAVIGNIFQKVLADTH